ncbi:Transposase [Oopsacas minuta]|uniref:Transposase n=1 Tax=Oopsacas minuta TaxID=111878 RepID=A0AAV7K5W0_9METZ|nr:Transposase [Oopsacas minuta]
MASKDDNFNLKWRAYIEFCTILKIQPVQIFSELQEILCVDCPSRFTVERWAVRFRSGDTDVTDLPRCGRPVSATPSENIALIESMVIKDKYISVNQLELRMEISSGAIHTILTTELGYRSICGKWVLHKLSENQRLARLNIAKKLLETYENCDSRCLTELITGNETWVYYSTPYSIIRSDHGSHGIVLQLLCESGKAVTATFFTEQVLPNLIKNIEKYRPKTGTRGMKILIDNASSHTAKLTKNFLDVEGLELLHHPPYSPDLAPCDFWLFSKLEIYLHGKDFNTLQALGTGLYQYFKSIPEEEYRNVFYRGWKG